MVKRAIFYYAHLAKEHFKIHPRAGNPVQKCNNMKSQYILRKNYLLNGWIISVERQTEVSNELDLLSNKERIDRQIEWLKELRDGVVDDDGEHNETQK